MRERCRAAAVARPRTANRPGSWSTTAFMDAAADEVVATPPASAIPSCTSRSTAAGAISRPAASTARPSSTGCSAAVPPPSRAHAMIDLTVVSVLLDAGAGPDWKYVEPATGQTFTRSEGLGVASFHAFTARPVLQRQEPPAAGRCRGPARPGHRPPGRGVPGERAQPAGRPRRPRRPAAPPGRSDVASSPRCSARTAGPAACST